MLSGEDVKRQVMEALRWTEATLNELGYQTRRSDVAAVGAALAPCTVLTPEERDFLRNLERRCEHMSTGDYQRAVALLSPHLTGPKRPPTGSTYVTDEPDFEILQEPAPEKTLDRLRKRVESGDWESDDVGPPAPGEGEPEDGYPNPELEVEC